MVRWLMILAGIASVLGCASSSDGGAEPTRPSSATTGSSTTVVEIQAWSAQVELICADFSDAADSLAADQPSSVQEAAVLYDEFGALAADQMRALEVVPRSDSDAEPFEQLMAALEAQAVVLEQLAEAAGRGDSAEVELLLAGVASEVDAQLGSLAQALRVPSCGP